MSKLEPIELTGNNREMAGQLLELLKNKSLTEEQLRELVPMNQDFLKNLCDVIKTETESNSQIYKSALGILQNSISNLQEIIKDNQITPEERQLIIAEISNIHKTLAEMVNNHEKSHMVSGNFLLC